MILNNFYNYAVKLRNLTIMNNEKLVKALFASGSGNKTESIIALVGGLAAGAVLGVLFAPASGKAARTKLADSFKKLVGIAIEEEEEPEAVETPQRKQIKKKPKSDIKDILHEAHGAGKFPEQVAN
jgi:gas vesicle protein